jgi:peptidylprolyl isomerase
MSKRFVITTWVALLTVLLLVVACGPAVSPDEAAELTRTAETGGETADGEAAENEAAVEESAPAGEPASGESVTTESGLVFTETQIGTGRAPEVGDLISMNAVGTLEDGTEFINTITQGSPIVVTMTEENLFPGWVEGLLLMKEGGKASLIIPPELAFGEEGAGGFIPPNATLNMDIELLSAAPPPTPPEVAEDDLTTTDSGLQYYDIVEGSGDIPVNGQDVVINYSVWLQDGNTFIASTFDSEEQQTFTLGSDMLLPGWDEGISTMKPGGRRLLVIPPELALGEQGGGQIPPNSTLLMEVELVEVKPLVLPTEVSEADFTTTDSGLKYYDLVEGDGEEAVSGSTVTVNYTGWLTDNVKFDSSLDAGFPFNFTLGAGEVIQGWDEGVAGMKVGGKRQLIIPAELGYGDGGAGTIPPGATLVFEVELMDVQPPATEE